MSIFKLGRIEPQPIVSIIRSWSGTTVSRSEFADDAPGQLDSRSFSQAVGAKVVRSPRNARDARTSPPTERGHHDKRQQRNANLGVANEKGARSARPFSQPEATNVTIIAP